MDERIPKGCGLEDYGSKFWEAKYWEVVKQFGNHQHTIIRARQLEELNQQQAAKIMQLELLLSCLTRVGEGVIVEHVKLMQLIKLFPDTLKHIRKKSRYE